MLDVTRLRVLAAVARHRSVTAAAQALHYSQPAVSHHLARLEAETGARLVRRVGRGVRLTEAGRLLAERAEEIIGRLAAAEQELAEITGVRAGRVRLAAFPSALGTFVPAAASAFSTAYPRVRLEFVEAEPPEAVNLLRAGEVDVAVVFEYADARLANHPWMRRYPLLAEPMLLVTPDNTPDNTPADTPASTPDNAPADTPASMPDNTPAGTPDRTAAGAGATGAEPPTVGPGDGLSAYADASWIGGCERCRVHLLACCADAGFTPRIAYTTDDYVAAQALVAAGLGVTTLPRLALTAHLRPDLRVTALPGPGRDVFATVYGEPPDPPATTALLDRLAAAATGT